jgi:hypothetical protein
MANNHIPAPNGRTGMIFGGGDGSYVSADMLKEVSIPTETLLGAANGALSGLVISGVVSAAISAGQHGAKTGMFQAVAKNWTGKHMLGIVAGTTALGAIGAIVRHSRAVKHNEWSEKHYAFLENQQHAGFAEREDTASAQAPAGKSR